MNRSIQMGFVVFDEIELVYGNASQDPAAETLLSQLEQSALAEARARCGILTSKGRPVTPEEYDALPDEVKELLEAALIQVGLAAFSVPMDEAILTVRLSQRIQETCCCTPFSVLNRLEKLDGVYSALYSRATMEVQALLGGKQGLMAMLYPWLKVSETSANEVAARLVPPRTAEVKPAPANLKVVQSEKRRGILERFLAGGHKPGGQRRPTRRDMHREYKWASGADPFMDRPDAFLYRQTKSKNVCTAGFLQSFRHISR